MNSLKNDANEIIVRNSRVEDADRIAEIARLTFDPPEIAFTKEHYLSEINIFPKGQVCVEYKGEIIGSCSSLIVNMDDYPKQHSLSQIADDGYIRNHNPNGKNLYGIDVIVHPDYQGMKVGKKLYEARRQLCQELNLESIVFGGRMPNFHQYAERMTAEEYVEKVIKEELYDPVLTFQLKRGFSFKYLMPGYLPTDPASMYTATFMEWKNKGYKS
ncbi:GNAT family N-acetyltransferase [Aquibacillus halophilus]|uniref:GNAT family N-acetyltransferase n=1 Tax=Aquibacillus halophilus TaxID=930132 RepID=A0A6A8DCV2_9BACI|nr:GNAT family N-acetyltransferase [Aquibacillus halophilus]MRH41709.1 GNAT family N-acetyltransferase [Aquibacillus halophilus]